MLNRQRLVEKLFTSFITVSISIIAAETALSNPILIDPSKEYRETDYIVNVGNAYDFCYDNKSLGYIVVSEAASERLERRYPIHSNCTIPTTSTTGSNSFSQFGSSDVFYSSTSSSKKQNRCQQGYSTYFRVGKNGNEQEVNCPKKRYK